jgi:hypothetical protein
VAAAKLHTGALQVVVRGPAPGGLKAREIAQALGLPLAGTVRADPDLPRQLERGQAPGATGRGPLAAFCRRLLADLELADDRTAA